MINSISDNNADFENNWINNTYADSELIIGLVGAVGTDLSQVSDIIKERLKLVPFRIIDVVIL